MDTLSILSNLAWSVRSSSRMEKDEMKENDGGIGFLESCMYYFIRVRENLVQHPSNKISSGL